MSFEMNCCWVAFMLAIVNLISLAVFFNYSLQVNSKDKAIIFSGSKDSLPVNLNAQTNYQDKEKQELKNKISKLEEDINQLTKKIDKGKNE